MVFAACVLIADGKMNRIRIGTRGSELALWQANYTADLIGRDKTEIIIIKTRGDRIQNVSFDKMEGKGFFTKEIEEALLDRRIDIAVHSMKDLPTENTPGLSVAAVMKREDPSDVLLVRNESVVRGGVLPLRAGATVGTSSLRRAAQLKFLMNSLNIAPLRGNVTTRVRRLREGRFDAIVLARAGLKRLEIEAANCEAAPLPVSSFLPAPAQGALALQTRDDDAVLRETLRALNDEETELAVTAERSFLERFGGGCHIPLGALGRVADGEIHLSGVVASTDGRTLMRKSISGHDPRAIGAALADQFKREGADTLL